MRLRSPNMLWPVSALTVSLAMGCDSGKADSGRTPPVTVSDLVLSFGVYQDTNGDEVLTPGESGFLYFDIHNNGDQFLIEVMGTVEINDDRLTGWINEERYWGMVWPGSSNSDPNYLTGTSLYGEEVSLARFDAGESGTLIQGTAELYEPCREPDYWFFPAQDEWIVHWCQENKADAYPLYSGPVSLLIENAPSGEDGLSMRMMGVEEDTNDNGIAEPRERVTWGIRVSLRREGDIDGLTGEVRCVDPYLESDVRSVFENRNLSPDYDSFDVEVTGTLLSDTPVGHSFTCTLDAVDAVGDRFTASVNTPLVQASSAEPVFLSVDATDHFDFSESSSISASMDVRVENIGGDSIPGARGRLESASPYVRISTSPEELIVGDISAGSSTSFDMFCNTK